MKKEWQYIPSYVRRYCLKKNTAFEKTSGTYECALLSVKMKI